MKIKLTPHKLQKRQNMEWLAADNSAITLPPDCPVNKSQLAQLESDLQAKVVYPWSPGYDDARKEMNDVFPAFPIIIVFIATYQDIQVCLDFAKNYKLAIALRSGRHSLADYSVCDGMVLDISQLKSIIVDTNNLTTSVQAGITFAELNPQLEFYGMHLPGGGCDTVSVAGYMQGGGYGITSRTFGIHSDCVLEFKMILANGTLVTANAIQNTDLFWAVRGGTGGNFGVLVETKYKIFPLGLIWGIAIDWDFELDTTNAAQALFIIQEKYLSGNQYPNLGIETQVFTDIAGNGHKKVRFGATFVGNETELNIAIAPLLAVPGATVFFKLQAKYSVINDQVLEGIPAIPDPQLPTIKYYGRSTFVEKHLNLNDYKNILSFFKTVPNTFGMLDLEGYGGVINAFPVENSAFIHRNTLFDFYAITFFDNVTNDQEKNRLWMIALFEFMEQYGNGHSYQNYPNRDQSGFQWAYWGPYYNQLVAIKKKYDPTNFFNYAQSIGTPLSPDREENQKILFDSSTKS